MLRLSMSYSIYSGRSGLASRRRCWPILMATARAPMLLRICCCSVSGTMPRGAASSTRAAVLAAARRAFSRVARKVAEGGTVDHHAGDYGQRDGHQQQLARQREPARPLLGSRPVAILLI